MAEDGSPDRRRRTLAPVVGVGVSGAAAAAVAGSRSWLSLTGESAVAVSAATRSALGEVPLVLTLSLVVLAAWGVVLVGRGRVRRLVAGLAALASAGLLAAVIIGGSRLPADVLAGLPGEAGVEVHLSGWFWLALVGATAALVAALVAWRWAPSWPEMGGRYDAPGEPAGRSHPHGRPSSADLWRALDDGRDPTD